MNKPQFENENSAHFDAPKNNVAVLFSLQDWRRRLCFILSFGVLAISS
jgi:hypothetical protein